jgi:hypothetical protein
MSEKRIIGRPFQTGVDPRREGNGRKPDDIIASIRGEARLTLVKMLCKFLDSPIGEIEQLINDKNLTVAESVAIHNLLQAASKDTSPAHLMTICKVLGLKTEEPAQVNINMSLESLVAGAHEDSNEYETTTPDGVKVITRKKSKDE